MSVDKNLHFNSKALMVEAALFSLSNMDMRFQVVSVTNTEEIVKRNEEAKLVTYIHNPRLKNQKPHMQGTHYYADLMMGGQPTRVTVDYADIVEISVPDGGALVNFSMYLNADELPDDLEEQVVSVTETSTRKNHLRLVH